MYTQSWLVFSHQKPCPKCGIPIRKESRLCRPCHVKAIGNNYVMKRCWHCRKHFRTHACQVGHYCSPSCRASGINKRRDLGRSLQMQCAQCGKEFSRPRSQAAKGTTGVTCCSRLCWYTFNQKDNHYLYTGGQDERVNPYATKWRKRVLKRDGRRCRLCMSTKRLQAHHIKPFGQYKSLRWKTDNGITLCRDCHASVRHREHEHEAMFLLMAVTPSFFADTESQVYDWLANHDPTAPDRYPEASAEILQAVPDV